MLSCNEFQDETPNSGSGTYKINYASVAKSRDDTPITRADLRLAVLRVMLPCMARPPKLSQLELFSAAAEVWTQDEDQQQVGYLTRIFAQTSLPYRDPGNIPVWARRNGKLSIVVQPGIKVDKDGVPHSRGYPFGTMPRLLLTWICSEAVKTQEPVLYLGSSLAEFLRELGIKPNGGQKAVVTRLREQMARLFTATITINWESERDNVEQERKLSVASQFTLWRSKGDLDLAASLPPSVVLSPDFFTEIIKHPVPLNLRLVQLLRGAPMRLDIYAWLTYRLFGLREPTMVSWEALRGQFGSNFADTRQGRSQFRHDFTKHLNEVLIVYPDANVEVTKAGVVLKPSRTSIPVKGLRSLTKGSAT